MEQQSMPNILPSVVVAALLSAGLLLSLGGCQSETSSTQVEAADSTQVASIWPSRVAEKDAALEKRLVEILNAMSTEQKVAQIIQPEIRDFTVEDMRRYGFGSYLNGGGAFPGNNKHATAADWIQLAEQMYQASIDDSQDGTNIPTMWGTDAVHGHNNVLGATIFPHNIGLGAAHNPALIHRIAEATAKEVSATGIDWVFAPTVAVARDIRWGRTYESYAEHPGLISEYAQAFVKGLQGQQNTFLNDQHNIATLKHFIGDGATQNGDDQGDAQIGEQELFAIHAPGYLAGIEAGAQTIMASFNSWNGVKNHGNHYLLTEVLKQRLGFDGIVVGDWNGHGQIPGCTNEHCPDAFNAGVDIFMAPGSSWRALYQNTLNDIAAGRISMARLDDAVSRILRVKLRYGLFEKPSPAKRSLASKQEMLGHPTHRDLARQAVRESLVLLKNHQQILPLSPKQRFLIAGNGADNIGKQSGGWSITWQGSGNSNDDFPGATSIYQGLRQAITTAGGQVEYHVSGDFEQKPDVAIVVFGEDPYAEGNGDIDSLEYQRGNKTDLQLLQKLKSKGIPVVSVFLSGRPLWVNAELNASDAFVAAWLPGTEGAGIADVLLKNQDDSIRHDFQGKLPFSWPNSPAPAIGNAELTLLDYGYGLRYGESDQLSLNLNTENASASKPESISLLDRVVNAPWTLYIGSENQLTAVTSNAQSAGPVSTRTIDRVVQEDARQFQFDGRGPGIAALRSDFPKDFRRVLEQQNALRFFVKPISLNGNSLKLGMHCGENCAIHIELLAHLKKLPADTWSELAIDIQCFNKSPMNFAQVFSPFWLQSADAVTLAISSVRIEPVSAEFTTLSCNAESQTP